MTQSVESYYERELALATDYARAFARQFPAEAGRLPDALKEFSGLEGRIDALGSHPDRAALMRDLEYAEFWARRGRHHEDRRERSPHAPEPSDCAARRRDVPARRAWRPPRRSRRRQNRPRLPF